MKRYQIVNRPSDGLELRQLDETAKHINELWARLTEFGEEFKKSTDTLTQAAGSLAGRVTVLENPPATEEPTDPVPTPPPIPTIVAAAAGGFINATVSTLEPVDSYDCQLQEEDVEDPPTEWQNAKYGTFSFIPPLPNTNYVVWARSRRAYLQSDWATSDVVNSGFLPYLLLDASNDPLTGTLTIQPDEGAGEHSLDLARRSDGEVHSWFVYTPGDGNFSELLHDTEFVDLFWIGHPDRNCGLEIYNEKSLGSVTYASTTLYGWSEDFSSYVSVDDGVILNAGGKVAITGANKIWLSAAIEGIEVSYAYRLLLYAVDPDTPPFELSENNSGVLVTGLNSDLLDGYHAAGMGMRHGFVSRTDNTLSFVDGTRIFTVAPTGASFDLYLSGVLYQKASSTTTIPNTVGLHFIYFDSSGVLQNSMSAWDITSPNAPVATIYWNGSAGAVIDERHGADRNLPWHEWAHLTIGTRYYTGLAGTFADSTFSIAAGTIYDEDLDHVITPAKTTCRLFYRSTGTFTFESGVTTPYKAAGGVLQYDNGSLTPVTAGRYIVNWAYACGDISYPVYIVVAQEEHTTIAAARGASPPATGNLPVTEMKLLYGVIYRYSGGAITYQEAIDFRAVAGPTGTYIASDHGVLSGLADDDHPQYALIDGTRPFTGAVTVGADAAGYDVTLYGATTGRLLLWDASADKLTINGYVDVAGSCQFGGANTDLLTCLGRLIVRFVDDAGMDESNGSQGEIVFNSNDSKFYGCTVAGSPATWAALN